jgi:hypothetical protein
MHIVPIFLYLYIGMHGSIVVGIVGNPSVLSFHVLFLLPGLLGRILVIFYVMLSLPSQGLTMRIG